VRRCRLSACRLHVSYLQGCVVISCVLLSCFLCLVCAHCSLSPLLCLGFRDRVVPFALFVPSIHSPPLTRSYSASCYCIRGLFMHRNTLFG
jgi:hypothetical protein